MKEDEKDFDLKMCACIFIYFVYISDINMYSKNSNNNKKYIKIV